YFISFVIYYLVLSFFFFFSSRRRHTRFKCDWSSDVCSSDLKINLRIAHRLPRRGDGVPFFRRRDQRNLSQHRIVAAVNRLHLKRSEERRVGKECRSRWGLYSRKCK